MKNSKREKDSLELLKNGSRDFSRETRKPWSVNNAILSVRFVVGKAVCAWILLLIFVIFAI